MEGPRYPGSLVVAHIKEQAYELASQYRRRKNAERASGRLSRIGGMLLAWEGFIMAGLFLLALGNVAVGIYMDERFDERMRRTHLIRYFSERYALSEECLKQLQESISHQQQLHRQARRMQATARTHAQACTARLRRRQESVRRCLGWAQPPSLASHGPLGYPLAAVAHPLRRLYVESQLRKWKEELDALTREVQHIDASLQHDESMVRNASATIAYLEAERAAQQQLRDALHEQLRRWQEHRCRTTLLAVGSELPASWGSGPGDWGLGGLRQGRGGGGKRDGCVRAWSLQVHVPSWADEEPGLLEELQELLQAWPAQLF